MTNLYGNLGHLAGALLVIPFVVGLVIVGIVAGIAAFTGRR